MRRAAIALLALAVSTSAFAKAKITIKNVNQPNVGFNDPTPAAPVGGNPGTTRGQQRLNAFQHAADLWGQIIDSDVEIVVEASMVDIECGADGAVLGQASAYTTAANFPGAPKADVDYPIALANKFAKTDLTPGQPHISAQFNTQLDLPTCLNDGVTDSNWYYGFDNKHGTDYDLVTVVLHELGHGLGFSAGVDSRTGRYFSGRNYPRPFDTFVLDNTKNQRWTSMTAAQRLASITNTGHLVWDGPSSKTAAQKTLKSVPVMTVASPSPIARNFDLGFAAFGPSAGDAVLNGRLVLATDDAESGSAFDGCTAFANAAAVKGNIAAVDRGNCNFIVKAHNAEAAGAKALLIMDNKRDTCLAPAMGNGGDTSPVAIPTISVNAVDADAIKPQLAAGIDVTLQVDPTFRSGIDGAGNVRLYSPCKVQPGSSVSHWDVVAAPNLLMEPSINFDLSHDVDLTVNELIDIGWSAASTTPAQPPPPTGRQFLKRGH